MAIRGDLRVCSEVSIRPAMPEDSEQLVMLMQVLSVEPEINLIYTYEEACMSVESQQKCIEDYTRNNDLFLVAVNGGRIVGDIMGHKERLQKATHCAELSIEILREYRNCGLGHGFMSEVIRWAQEQHIHRLQLEVYATNAAAIHLYEKFGFEIEGRKRDYVLQDGRYIDLLVMGRLFDH